MQQYHAAKQENPDCLLFFRLGDFFELFFEDALTASEALGITLTKRRDGKGAAIPMCGVPAQSADGYLAQLLEKGHRVAICDQVEEAKKARGLVKREIVRVLSPGTTSDLNLLKAGENNYLAATLQKRGSAGVAYVDVSTGEFRATEVAAHEVESLLASVGAKEVLGVASSPLLAAADPGDRERAERRYTRTPIDAWVFDFEYAERLLRETMGLHTLKGLGIASRQLAISAAGALVHYLRETQRSALQHLEPPAYFEQQDWMVLDPVTTRHLELFDPLYQETRTTLLYALDRTATPMGSRLLRNWLLRPSLQAAEIEERHEAVACLCRGTIVRAEIERELRQLHDVERLLARITLGSAGPRDVFNLGMSLRRLPALRALVSQLQSSKTASLLDRLDSLEDICARIVSTIAEEPPAQLGDGGAIADGYDAELDQLRDIRSNSRSFIAQLEQRERETTGIESLKVRFNNVFGFFIEVSKANLAKVPERYDRKQTLVNAERFSTLELKELEAKVLDAEERIAEKEAILFEQLRAEIAAQARRVRLTAVAIAELDVLRNLAQVAVEHDYVRPTFSAASEIQIEGGRHPVVERMLQQERGERFIENDTYLDNEQRLLAIITGPNMGGKSTYLRQTALIAIMAQMGSFVPARKAVLPLIDRVFTRIGASDNLAYGYSTFMVEMTETAQILNIASERSLILLDEIGRGTSTYDGLAIAWAVAEHIHSRVRAKTLFATHYHELTALPAAHAGIFNLHVSVKQAGDRLVFLRRVEPGKADRSYGIEVARLAGLPRGVVSRAKDVLAEHERSDTVPPQAEPKPEGPGQRKIFEALPEGLLEELRSLNLDTLRPIEALALLHDWKKHLDR